MRSTPGSEIFSSASIPKPVSIGPMPMIPVIETSAGKATFSFRATNFNAPKKQAEYPAAKSCSGLVPASPFPPNSLGVVNFTSKTLSEEMALPSRPPVAVAVDWVW